MKNPNGPIWDNQIQLRSVRGEIVYQQRYQPQYGMLRSTRRA